jgi:hypothetical protein
VQSKQLVYVSACKEDYLCFGKKELKLLGPTTVLQEFPKYEQITLKFLEHNWSLSEKKIKSNDTSQQHATIIFQKR